VKRGNGSNSHKGKKAFQKEKKKTRRKNLSLDQGEGGKDQVWWPRREKRKGQRAQESKVPLSGPAGGGGEETANIRKGKKKGGEN